MGMIAMMVVLIVRVMIRKRKQYIDNGVDNEDDNSECDRN